MADDLQYKVYLLEGQENFVTETKEYTLKKEYQFSVCGFPTPYGRI